MQTYTVTLTGKMPLLMHADNIDWADEMDRWKSNAANKKASKAGDDRSPAFRWLGSLYHDGELVALPADNLMRCLMEGGALVPVPCKARQTFKSQTQSGLMIDGMYWPLQNGASSSVVKVAPILALRDETEFEAHRAAAESMGFSLFVKRARIGANKHVRVRPMFEKWIVSGNINVWDTQITKGILQEILTQAGLYKGLGDWRPSSKTPGPFGMFTAIVQ
jgi:hypothetical protein